MTKDFATTIFLFYIFFVTSYVLVVVDVDDHVLSDVFENFFFVQMFFLFFVLLQTMFTGNVMKKNKSHQIYVVSQQQLDQP